MTSFAAISSLSTLSPIPVVFDVTFLLLAMLIASIVVPLMGAMFLGMWCRMMDVEAPCYRRRALAYAAGYFAAVAAATLMLLLVKDFGTVPGWFLAAILGQAVALHALIVPLVLKTPWGKQIAAQALALMLYGAVLVIGMAPVIVYVRKGVDRAEWKVELQRLYQMVTSGKGMEVDQLPETLDAVEQTGRKIVLLPDHSRRDVVYLGDYIERGYRSTHQDFFPGSMARIRLKHPEISPLIWRNPDTLQDHRVPVCSYDGSVAFLTRREFDYHLDQTLLELGKTESPSVAPDSDQP